MTSDTAIAKQLVEPTVSAKQSWLTSWRKLPSGWGPLGSELLVAIPLYVLLALVFTFPLVLNFTTYIPGDMEGDVWKHLWGMWWIKHKLVEECVLPIHTHLLNYPYGGALFFIDPLNGLLSVPLQYFFAMPVVFNIMVLFNIVLAATACYCLCRYLCGNSHAAFFGGAVYGFSAYMAAYITSGVTEAINIGWMPLFFLFYIRMLRNKRLADACRAGLFFGLATVGSWYYGTFCVLFAVFHYLYILMQRYRSQLKWLFVQVGLGLQWPWSTRLWSSVGLVAASASLAFCLREISDPFAAPWYLAVFAVGSMVAAAAFIIVLLTDGESRRHILLVTLALMWLPSTLAISELWLCAQVCFGVDRLITNESIAIGQASIVWLVCWMVMSRLYSRRAALVRVMLERAWRLLLAAFLFAGSLCAFSVSIQDLQNSSVVEPLLGSSLAFVLSCVLFGSLLGRHLGGSIVRKNLGNYWHFVQARWLWVLVVVLLTGALMRLVMPKAPLWPYSITLLCVLGLLQVVGAMVLAIYESAAKRVAAVGNAKLTSAFNDFNVRMLLRPGLMVLLGCLIIVGPAVEFRRTINSEESIVFRRREETNVDIHLSRQFLNVCTLVDLGRMGKLNPTISYTVDKLTRVPYLGWVTMLIGLGSVVVGYRRRQTWFWTAMAVIFAFFSLGPFMYITDEIYSAHKSVIYMAFFRYFPLFSQVSIPYRFITVVMAALAVLCSYALSGLYRRWKSVDRVLATAGLTLAMLFDVVLLSPVPYPIPLSSVRMPDYCAALAAEKGDSGLLDIPIQRYKGELLPGEYFYFQIKHRKAIPNRVEGTVPLFVFQNSFANYLFILEHAQEDIPPRNQVDLQMGLEDMSRFRFRHIVVHDRLLRNSARERLHTLLSHYLGQPKSYADGVKVYHIPPGLILNGGKRKASPTTKTS